MPPSPTPPGLRWADVRGAIRDPLTAVTIVVALGFLLWGPEGRTLLPDGWLPDEPWLAWTLRFALGAAVMVLAPALALRLWARPTDERERRLTAWGFGLGDWRLGLPLAIGLTVAGSALVFFTASNDPGLRAEYPLFAPGPTEEPLPVGTFLAYEAAYFLFFLCGEAAMRGLLLFGLERRVGGPLAVLLTTVIQVVWHTGKPLAELATVPLWGLAAGALNLRLRSFWWMLLAHWATNVTLDAAIHYSP